MRIAQALRPLKFLRIFQLLRRRLAAQSLCCPFVVPTNIGRSAIINMALCIPSLASGRPLFHRSELRVKCSGPSDGLAFFVLSPFGATGGAATFFGPGPGPSYFAVVAGSATGAAFTLGISGVLSFSFGASFAGSALSGVTARAICSPCGLGASVFALTGFGGSR